MIRILRKNKKKNPHFENKVELLLKPYNPTNIKFIDEGFHGEIYSFINNSNRLKSGKYVIKILRTALSSDDRAYLKSLSNHGLIPKVYEIKEYYYIMKFVNAKTLDSIYTKFSKSDLKIIVNEIKKLVAIWHKLGYAHGDINTRNIMITESGKIYIIDPILTEFAEDVDYIEDLYYDLNLK